MFLEETVEAGQTQQCTIWGYNNFIGRKNLPVFLTLLHPDRAGNMAEAAFLVGFPNFALGGLLELAI